MAVKKSKNIYSAIAWLSIYLQKKAKNLLPLKLWDRTAFSSINNYGAVKKAWNQPHGATSTAGRVINHKMRQEINQGGGGELAKNRSGNEPQGGISTTRRESNQNCGGVSPSISLSFSLPLDCCRIFAIFSPFPFLNDSNNLKMCFVDMICTFFLTAILNWRECRAL